jgi:hypothetical protein
MGENIPKIKGIGPGGHSMFKMYTTYTHQKKLFGELGEGTFFFPTL